MPTPSLTTQKEINLHLDKLNDLVYVQAKQYDALSRNIKINLFFNDAPWTLPGNIALSSTGSTSAIYAMVRYLKPDGTKGMYDTDEENNQAVTGTSGNSYIIVRLAEQVLVVKGKVFTEISFYNADGQKLTSFGFIINVEASSVSDEEYVSSDYYNLLRHDIQAIYDLNDAFVSATQAAVSGTLTIDDTLTIHGAIADAKAAGEIVLSQLDIDAQPYSTSATYSVGDYCLQNNKLYRCTTAITSGESWNSAHWFEVVSNMVLVDDPDEEIEIATMEDLINYSRYDDVNTDISKILLTPGAYRIPTNDETPVTFEKEDSDTYVGNCVTCSQGDVFYAKLYGKSGVRRAYAFTDADGYILQKAVTNAVINGQLIAPENSAFVIFQTYIADGADWYAIKGVPICIRVQENKNDIYSIEKNIYELYTDLQNLNINANTGLPSGSTHPLSSKNFISIDRFISINVTGRSSAAAIRYQFFCYDSEYNYLGGGTTAYRDVVTTRDQILEAYPLTKFLKVKISDGETRLSVDSLDSYGYNCLILKDFGTDVETEDEKNIWTLIENYKDENSQFTESFSISMDLGSNIQNLSISAKYTGEMPTIRFLDINPASNAVYLRSPVYELGSSREFVTKTWRIPMASGVATKLTINIDIPDGTILEMQNAILHDDQRNRYMDSGIKFHGHLGSIAPSNTVEAFNISSKLGYNSLITVPKFTLDGVGVCFHDDTTISGDLYWMDGTPITGEYDRGISTYTYQDITSNFRIKKTGWGILHVPTLEDYFRVCSLTGMHPILSVHSSGFGGISTQNNFEIIKNLAKKWRVLDKLSIKSGNTSIQSDARNVFGTDIDSYIFLSGQTHAPYNQLNIAKSCGFVEQDATDLSNCQYRLVSEYFYAQTVDTGTYYTETLASISECSSQGFIISIAETGNGISGPEMERLINLGVTEFTVDGHISMGLYW